MMQSVPTSGIFWPLAGIALGAVYFLLLGRSVAVIGGMGDWRGAVGAFAVRIGLAAGVFALAAMQGVAPLLLTLIGFLVARTVVIARMKRGP